MSFRARLTLVSAGAVAVAVALASAITYVVVRGELRGRADDALRSRAAAISPGSIGGTFFSDIPNPELGDAPGYLQLVGRDGRTIRPPHEAAAIPVTAAARAVAAGRSGSSFADASVSGRHMRILTVPIAAAWALQIGLPLAETDHALRRARTFLILVGFCGIGPAAAFGLAVARTALAPVRRLTAASEHVTKTRDLGSRIDTRGRGELSRLAVSFNTMLAALEESVRAQHQLVSDASHELRTPLTTLRTNIEVLLRGPELPAAERDQLLRDVVEQLEEMTALVAALVELARVDAGATGGRRDAHSARLLRTP
ncbi:MAG: histidine kinase dimerization/phospho-acceptor domain-containing protein [Gaiellaceae bacterium]